MENSKLTAAEIFSRKLFIAFTVLFYPVRVISDKHTSLGFSEFNIDKRSSKQSVLLSFEGQNPNLYVFTLIPGWHGILRPRYLTARRARHPDGNRAEGILSA